VLVVGRGIHPPWNEGTRVIAWLTARAAASRTSVRTVSLTDVAYQEDASPVTDVDYVMSRHSYGVKGDYLALPALVRRLNRVIAEQRTEVVHLIGAPLILAPWLRSRGVRVVAHVTLARQAYLPLAERVRAALAWRVFDPWVDAYACSGVAVRDALLRQGRARHKLLVVPPPVDFEEFSQGDRAAARRDLGWPEDAFVVLYVGTLSPIRFPALDIFNGFRLAAPEIPSLRLEVIAPVATHGYNVAWAEDVRSHRSLAGIPVGVHLRDLSIDEKRMLYRGADALLVPFAGPVAVEPPLTLLEGMACGAVPVVSPDANRSGIVIDRENGFTWQGAAALSRALVDVARLDETERARLGASARGRIETEHGPNAVATALEAAWASVLPTTTAAERRGARGVTVAIVGPDGAGKSSLVAALDSNPDLPTLAIYMGVDRLKATHALPTTRWMVARRERASRRGGIPPSPRAPSSLRAGHRRRGGAFITAVRRVARNLLSLPHELAEFGYRYLVGLNARSSGRVVLFDRYIYDALVDVRVDNRSGWEAFRARVLARLIPPPDLMIVLTAPGEVLFARKPEHAPDRLSAVGREHLRVARRAHHVAELDATRSPGELLADAIRAIRAVADAGAPLDGDRRP
jgi:glycosyltransferase involved in cell wall biosynthesis/thymidylate kinase